MDEIWSPGETNINILFSGPGGYIGDEIDNESTTNKGAVIDQNDEQEPRLAFPDPAKTEETEQACDVSDTPKREICCFLSRSRYLQKKCRELFHAVYYHQKDQMEKILEG